MLKLIKTTVLDASAASVTISNIPQEFKTLKLVVSARGTNSSNVVEINMAPNNSTSNLSWRLIEGDASTAYSANNTTSRIGAIPAASNTASTFGSLEYVFPNYSGATNKPYSGVLVTENNASFGAYQDIKAVLWSNTSAITSMVFSVSSGSFAAGSTFYLYGIA